MINRQRALWAIASSIKTDLTPTGVGSCSSDFIAQRLADSASILVEDDLKSREIVCDWFLSNGINLKNLCDTNIPNNHTTNKLNIAPSTVDASGHPSALMTCEKP
jgi:hypothetical protein